MSVKEIYMKTLKFGFIKMGIQGVVLAISLVTLAICLGLGALFKSSLVSMILLLIWIIVTAVVYRMALSYMGYLIRAAHVAIVSKAVTEGVIPDNMVEVGKQMVQERFGATNSYVVINHLVNGAVRQLQQVVNKVDNLLDGIPGLEKVMDVVKVFIRIFLGYIDECCLGYTFYKKGENAFKCGCDGVVIYFQNAKHLLKSALVTSILVVVLTFFSWFVPFLVFAGIFTLFGLSSGYGVAAIISILVAVAVKEAFIDPFILVQTMTAYMEVAPQTEITVDLYDKLSGISGKFRDLLGRARKEVGHVI